MTAHAQFYLPRDLYDSNFRKSKNPILDINDKGRRKLTNSLYGILGPLSE